MEYSPGGSGGCQAEIEFKPPKIIAGTLPKSRTGLHLALGGIHTSVCKGPCGKTVFGRFEIKLRSRDQLNKLFGRVLAFTVEIRCSAKTLREQVNVFVDKHGVLRRPPTRVPTHLAPALRPGGAHWTATAFPR